MMLTASKIRAQVTADTDEAERKLRQVGKTVDGVKTGVSVFGQVGADVFGGLGFNIAQFAGPAGIGMAVAAVAKGVISLNAMREESEQLEARFRAFTGGAREADEVLKAYDQTLGNALTKDEKMGAASQLLGLGLAKNAQDAAQLTQQALLLGMSMDTLTQALETGRINGLVQYGISVDDVKRRAEELKQTTAGLSDVEATAAAVKEQLADKAKRVADEGGKAVTPTKELANAFNDLKDSVADFVNLDDRVRSITRAINELNTTTQGAKALKDSLDPAQGVDAQIKAAEDRLQYLQDLRQRYENGENLYRFNPAGNAAEIEALQVKISGWKMYGAAADDVRVKLDAYLDAARTAGEAQNEYNWALEHGGEDQQAFAQAQLTSAEQARDLALQAYQAAAGIAESGRVASAAAVEYDTLAASAATAASIMKDAASNAVNSPQNAANRAWQNGGSGSFYGAQWDAKLAADKKAGDEALRRRQEAKQQAEQQARETQSAMERANRQIVQDWESAMRESVSRITSKFQEGMQFSQGLSDLTGGNPLRPGANGPFEDIYRLQAWVKDGTWGETAAKAGIGSKEQAQALIGNFQRGNFTEDVLKLVNMPQLEGILKGEDDAKASQDRLAKLIGIDPKKLKGTLGLDTAGAGAVLSDADSQALAKQLSGKTNAALSKAASEGLKIDFKGGLADALLKAVDADLVLKRNDLLTKGGVAWGVLEDGMLDKASKSTKFVIMVDAMVDNALANYVPKNK